MSSEIIKRDQDFRTVGAGVSNDASHDILMLRVDPVTKYLLVNLAATAATSAISVQVAKRDGNYRPVCLAWDDTNKVLQEVLTDSSGNLLCDVLAN